MEAKELRLGNLIYIINKKQYIHLPDEIPFKIVSISIAGVEGIPLKENLVHIEEPPNFPLCDISPIPLTGAWLLKFGFKEGFHNKEFIKGDMIVYTHNKVNKEVYFSIWGEIIIKHVHQLQNLWFVLTDSELTVKDRRR